MPAGGITFIASIRRAIYRARIEMIAMGLVYIVSVCTGAVMVHRGNQFALNYRDKIVNAAHKNDPSAIAYKKGQKLKAAFIDFVRNLFIGAVPQTVTGLTVVSPYAFAAYRGWVGGIVSVDSQHRSRLSPTKQMLYFITTLILQLIPYSLAGGIGVKLGLTYFRQYKEYRNGKKWFGYPVEALLDVARVYALIAPLFFIASLWEFMSPWN